MTYSQWLLTAALLSLATASYAQDQPTAPTAPTARLTEVVYLDANRHQLPSEQGAVERKETIYRDTVSGTTRTYYLPSGKLKSFVPFASVRKNLRHGTVSEYYESGQLRYQASFQAGHVVGDLVTYYPDGTLKRREHHQSDQPDTGECFGPDGQPVAYFPYEQMPVYSEGAGDKAAMVRAVMLNVRYPVDALKQRVYGVVKVSFVVGKDGRVQDIKPNDIKPGDVPKGIARAYESLQDAAVSAVRQLKPFAPGRQDGEPVAVSFTVPVTFRIQ
ncbi:energy transducer TonB [Hymenobacter properus]|uniref:Energy transducer TonB n=1 Tax=Hymenobacter properus TaxID=2791026 RepID=A0A931BIR2_9BACT|nr:energy transducer TonB [Hymenobacter properus]MBF9140230.1 energy transducer TonB [Hymenobacter properus]MBR7719037.1 energy transducer TonB [Microvirga sp. SRT04]